MFEEVDIIRMREKPYMFRFKADDQKVAVYADSKEEAIRKYNEMITELNEKYGISVWVQFLGQTEDPSIIKELKDELQFHNTYTGDIEKIEWIETVLKARDVLVK